VESPVIYRTSGPIFAKISDAKDLAGTHSKQAAIRILIKYFMVNLPTKNLVTFKS
jgi:hypothetical protein